MDLLEREAELETLATALREVSAGERRTIGLFGEAGIGKSALLAAAHERAVHRLLVLASRAAEHEREVPFSLVVDALDDYVASLRPERVRAAGAELGAVLPSAAQEVGSATEDFGGPAERYRYHRALRALLELVGRERPFVLLLDDLHWADEASVEFVLHLLRRSPRVPHLLLFALRPVDPAGRLLDAARSAAGWGEVRLAGLSDEAAMALLGDDLSPALRERMASEAAGNPLFLRELARLGADAADSLPNTVVATVLQEISDLGSEARTLIDGAAVAGDPFDPTWLRRPPGSRLRQPSLRSTSSPLSTSCMPKVGAPSGSATRWSGARSTMPRHPAGGSRPMSARRPRSLPARPSRSRGPTTSSSSPDPATRTQWPF